MRIPKELVIRNRKSMIYPNRLIIGPIIEPALVATINSNELPPHPLRNWIITAFCKRMASEYPFAGQNHTFKRAVLLYCLNGVLRAGRRVLAVRSCKRGNIILISPYHLYKDFFNQYSHFDSLKCYEVRTSADMHFRFF